ncbi:glycosyltransferase [Mangrovimonas sp. AS39]|uniref:glycosyltransferase family 2 protein n=1 Tax=Mangrovimonas futianensis TaxID=2895523 RepID=UPI001E4F5138|nr:glycosyltransferase [Mangrovimonas futianensis]MCF1190819.1 glycosyltransferase [Mangrovimonas futianensis]MCF1194516.1 glycosyltransferase [Mangrovimonas futianensis]
MKESINFKSKEYPFLKVPTRVTEQIWDESTSPLVSISCITYNQESLIKDAIEGFLMQETTFRVMIHIYDDASTDDTVEVIDSYVQKYPNLFKTIYQAENQRSKGIKTRPQIQYPTLKDCKYIANCDGDDYWIDSSKLQKQVDFLELNPEYIICSHCVKYYYEEDNTLGVDAHLPGEYTIVDLTKTVPFQSVSVVLRNDPKLSLPNWFAQISTGDWGLYLFLLQHGGAKKMEDVMGVYRIHSNGVWAGNYSKQNLMRLTTLWVLKDKFSENVNTLLTKNYLKYLVLVYNEYIKTNQYDKACELFEKSKAEIPIEYYPLFEVGTSILIQNQKELIQKNELINKIMTSKSYKLGNKIINAITFMFPFKRKTNDF